MVHVDRYQPDNVRNGRSRGPSPNGHNGSPDTSDDDSTKNAKGNKKAKNEYEEKIRVGKDYQTMCPDFIPPNERKLDTINDRALLVWSPTKDIPDSKLEDYINVAKEKYGYNGEQALGMLFWHKHDLERAVMDLANFTPFPDEWTEEDKVLFEQAFHFHGKSFHRIRQMLPDKNIASLVKYYYSWKKTRTRTSVMDRQEKMKAKEGSENGSSENGSNDDSDSEDKKWPLHRGIRRASRSPPPRTSDESNNSVSSYAIKQANMNQNSGNSIATNQANVGAGSATKDGTTSNSNAEPATKVSHASNNTLPSDSKIDANGQLDAGNAQLGNAAQTKDCVGCGVPCNQTNTSPHGALCNSCYHHWSRTGTLRPTSGPGLKRSRNNTNTNGVERHKSKLPRGMYINHDDIVTLAAQSADPNKRGDDLLTSMDREISSLLSQIQNNKQISSCMKAKRSVDTMVRLHPGDAAMNRNVSRWNNDEMQIAVKGFRRHGKDFQAIAEIIGTKNEQQVRSFYANYRKKFYLDDIVKEFDEEQQRQQERKASNDANEQKQSVKLSDGQQFDDSKRSLASDSSGDVMEIDLVEDIPNQEDEDMDDVTIIETDTMPSTTQKSNGIAKKVEAMDSISITAISSSSSSSSSSANSHNSQEPVPEVTISPAPSLLQSGASQSSLAAAVSTVTSTSSLLAIVEQAKAAAV